MLVDRTKAEVAGTLLTAQLALKHGLACNTAGTGTMCLWDADCVLSQMLNPSQGARPWG